MEIHNIMRYHYTPSKLAKIKILIIPNVGEEEGQLEFSKAVIGNVKWYNFRKEFS